MNLLSWNFGLKVLMEHVMSFVKCTTLLRKCLVCALSWIVCETYWSIRGVGCEYNLTSVPNDQTGQLVKGSPASVELSYYRLLMGERQKPICFCTVNIILHALLLHTPTWPHVGARQRQGHPQPGTCQHRSWVEPCALMPYDRQGTTR